MNLVNAKCLNRLRTSSATPGCSKISARDSSLTSSVKAYFSSPVVLERVTHCKFANRVRRIPTMSCGSGTPRCKVNINDSDHSAEYEHREYQTIAPKLSPGGGLILGDNCHCTDVLAAFSELQGRQFIFFREEPKDHWYPGGGIGISFVRQKEDSLQQRPA